MSSFPACKVCQKQFSLKGPAPYLLPCLHSVCETCIISAAGRVISCGPCQREVNLSEACLHKDLITEKEVLHLTVQKNPELVLCTHEDDGNQAVCWCKECEDFLCEHCQNVHGSFKGTKQHTVYDVGDLELGNLNEDRYCRIHPKFIADTWDTNCRVLTCRKCRLGDHSRHRVVDVEEVVQTSRKAVAALHKEVQSFVDKHRAHLAKATKDLQNSAKCDGIQPEKISHTFNSLKTLIDQREVELRIAHQQQKKKVEKHLQDKKNSSDVCLQRCQTTSDYISKTMKYSSMHDIVELRPLLEEKSKDCRSSAPSEDYKSLPLPVFNSEGLAKIKSTLGKFGIVSTNACSQDNQKEGAQGFIQGMLNICRSFIMFLGLVAVAFIVSMSFVEPPDCKTQTEILTKKLKLMEESEGNLFREKKERERGPHVEFSRTRYNADDVYVNDEGELINEREPNPPYSDHRLKVYGGTSSTFPLSRSVSPQYWEVKTHLVLVETLTPHMLLLDIGLATQEEQDQGEYIGSKPNSFSFSITHCSKQEKPFFCTSDYLANTPGASATLHHGVIFDSGRGRIVFLDLVHELIIDKIDGVDSSVALWPMFGVYNRHWAKMSMSLIVGNDIDMTDSKKTLIIESLL